ncbi:MAG: hypothetical protein JWQ98_2190 [Chlorobi bacterium]|nr:hypothetical protein [Chlorobiota bacterium]
MPEMKLTPAWMDDTFDDENPTREGTPENIGYFIFCSTAAGRYALEMKSLFPIPA